MSGGTVSQASEIPVLAIPAKTGENLNAHQHKCVYWSDEGTIMLMTASGFTQIFAGVLVDEPNAEVGSHVSVGVIGVFKMVAGAAINAFANVMNGDSQGRVITATDNNQVVGIAMEGASAINQVISVLLVRNVIKGDNT